jgi:hypothetical protein
MQLPFRRRLISPLGATAFDSRRNETPVVPDRLEFLKNLAVYTRAIDSTRLIRRNRRTSPSNGRVRCARFPSGAGFASALERNDAQPFPLA